MNMCALFRVGILVLSASGVSAIGQQARHRELGRVAEALRASENEVVVWVRVGDSRSSWRHWRGPGEFYRQFDVKHAALVCPAGEANNGERDGLGQLLVSLGGISSAAAAPGSTLPSSGITNSLPSSICEAWTTATSINPNFSRYVLVNSSAGGFMDSSGSDDSGGTFKRGDPAQGRAIASIDRFALTDNRPQNVWLRTVFEFGYGSESGAGGPVVLAAPPPSPTNDLLLTKQTLVHGTSTGALVRVRHRHVESSPVIGTGHVLAATRINFADNGGVVYGVIAEGGWSATDHMAADVAGRPLNTDAKYTDAGLREWLGKVMGVEGKTVVFEVDIGTNTSTIPGYLEWNGVTTGSYRENVRSMARRLRDQAVASGASQVIILLTSPWQAPQDNVRNNFVRSDLESLSSQEGWSYYDQEGELRDRGLSDGGLVGLALEYREDIVHQNFFGMNLLGQVKWTTITRGQCNSIDFNRDGLFPDDSDVIDFLRVLAGGQCESCDGIDFNNDGLFPDDTDLIAFLRVLAGGSC